MENTEQYNRVAEKLLEKFKQNPQYDLMQEYGKLLIKHIDDFTPEERKRYDELTAILCKEKA